MPPILEVKDLKYRYGSIQALKGISFHVDEGEIVCLVGSNGAGKTTTLQCISGLLDHRGMEGDVFFAGASIRKLPAHRVSSVGVCQVLEGRHIFPMLTVEENLEMGAYMRRDKRDIKEDIRRMYRLFPRLEERKTKQGMTLSGGEQQMLAIARALIRRPRLIMLDEPSLGLAPIIVQEIFRTIRQINQEGMSILLVEQNCNLALDTASRGYVIETGRIVLEGKSERLKNDENVKKSYLGG